MLESTDIRKIVRLNGMAHVLQVLLGFALSCIILPQFYIRKSHVYFLLFYLRCDQLFSTGDWGLRPMGHKERYGVTISISIESKQRNTNGPVN